MDYPKSVPGVGLVNGKFVDENQATGQVGSLIPSAWGNAVTDEILAVLAEGGVVAAEGNNSQLKTAIKNIITASSIAWAKITGKPTTLAGYGITDALGCRVAVEVEEAGVSWNTIVAGGLYPKIILGTNPDGPGPALHFYCRTYVRIPVAGGSGALQQFAEPYGTPTSVGQMYWRGLNGTTWTPWVKVMDSTDAASQADAEGGTEASRWMSSLRVFQAMVKYGLGATSLPTLTTVADSTTPSGLYQVAGSATGLPVAEDGFIDIRRGGAGLVSQRYFSRTSSRAFFRRGNGSLGAWDEFLHTGLLASQAEVDAGADDRKYLTPKKLRWGFAISLATNGYVVFPSWLGGLVIQWGKVATPSADTEYSATFPLAFPTAVFNVTASLGYNDSRLNDGAVAQTRLITQTGFVANRQDIGSVSSLPNCYIHYLAVGH
ncbi:pyocin knob domain-containing protein [Pseudomonas aeruginosa]